MLGLKEEEVVREAEGVSVIDRVLVRVCVADGEGGGFVIVTETVAVGDD